MKRKIEIVLKFIFGLTRSLYRSQELFIKRGYIHRKNYSYLNATNSTEELQKEVYEIASNYFKERKFKNIADFGCGSGFKLLKYFHDFETIGIDVKPTYDYLREKYPDRNWLDIHTLNPSELNVDMVICADVIEHLENPMELIDSLKLTNFKLLFISTPERDIVRGFYDFGPPSNKFHIREWNGKEFKKFISCHFNIVSHQITNFEQGTQLLICEKKLSL